MTPGRSHWVLAALLTPGAVVGAAGQAPALQDGAWAPYLGCWVDDADPRGPMTCVVPDGDGAAFLTISGSTVVDRRMARDGAERPIDRAGCTGTESFHRADGNRFYTRASARCGTVNRETRGLMAMVAADAWIHARASADAAWVTRYRPAPAERVHAAALDLTETAAIAPRELDAARAAAARRVTVEHVIEAYAHTSGAVVRAWLAERGAPLRLNADALVRMADAGVPPDVIDVAVAVSFPDRFDVAGQPEPRDPGPQRGDRHRPGAFYTPVYGYAPFGLYGSGAWWYGWNRYGAYGYPGAYGGPRPYTVVVVPADRGPGGRVVRGRGYTRDDAGDAATRRSRFDPAPSRATADRGRRRSPASGARGKAKPKGGG